MAIRLYETKMEFDYDSSDGTVKTTHTVYIESDGLYFDGTIYGTGSPGVIISSPVSSDSSGLATGDFEFQPNQIAFGSNTLFAKADGSGVVFSGTIGATLDSIEILPGITGSVAGFISGGFSPPRINNIDKFPFNISSGTATQTGTLITVISGHAGHSSDTDGFTAGGIEATRMTTIEKFPFAISGGTATDVGDLITGRSAVHGNSSQTDGFIAGGLIPAQTDTIEKFPFAISSGTATNVGNLPTNRADAAAHTSETDGFMSAGEISPTVRTANITKFPFSISGGNAVNTGGLIADGSIDRHDGVSSLTDGFAVGGLRPNIYVQDITKFPFAISSGTSTNVGTVHTAGLGWSSGVQSTADAFITGGLSPTGGGILNNIHKFPFVISSGTATDVGDLAYTRYTAAGHQD